MRLDGWKAGKKKPDNMYKHFRNLGLVVVFPGRRGYSFVANDDFYGPFPEVQQSTHRFLVCCLVRRASAGSRASSRTRQNPLAPSEKLIRFRGLQYLTP